MQIDILSVFQKKKEKIQKEINIVVFSKQFEDLKGN